jgi:hypothetical protein
MPAAGPPVDSVRVMSARAGIIEVVVEVAVVVRRKDGG